MDISLLSLAVLRSYEIVTTTWAKFIKKRQEKRNESQDVIE